MTSFTRKRIDVTITLGEGEFGETVGDTVTLTGHRILAEVLKPGGDSMGELHLRIYGLKQEMMNRLSVIGQIGQVKAKNKILLAAGDDAVGMTTVFQGTLWEAVADYSGMPDVSFNIVALAGMDLALKPVDAISFKGATDVATIMRGLADDMGLAFENNGVSVVLSNPYFPGTGLAQVRKCAAAANINHTIDLQKLVIWPKDGFRAGAIPIISPDTGMIGYPRMSSKGIDLQSVFNTDILLGGQVEVRSSVEVANGIFNVFDFSHSLSCEMPGGPWFTSIRCYPA